MNKLGFVSSLALVTIAGSAAAQERNAFFDAPLVVGDYQTRFQKLADINGDGFMDAYSGWWLDDQYSTLKLTAYINDGNGALVKSWSRYPSVTPSNTSIWSFDAGDVNADGFGDVVFGAGLYVQLFLAGPGGGQSELSASWQTPAPNVTGVQLIDVDGDGQLEIAVLHGALTILRYDGTGALNRIAALPLGASAGELRVADVDGVGGPDLLGWDTTRVYLIPLIGGVPQAPQVFAHGCTTPKGMAGDIDGDGDEDVVVMDTGTYVVLRRTARSSYSFEGPTAGGPARFLVDIDQDGDVDGVCCGSGGPSPVHNNNPSIFRIALNDGAGHFAPSLEFPGMGSERMAGAADLDHDGDMDIVAGRCIYYGVDKFLDGVPRKLAFAPRTCALADLEGDLDPDLEPGMSTLRNAGDGSFASYVPVLPSAPVGKAWIGPGFPGDFDGDGDLDLLVLQRAGASFEHMRLLTNQGGGSFVDGGQACAAGVDFTYSWIGPPSARNAIAQDADGDGDVDLIVCGAPFAYSKLYWNDGHGFFSVGPDWSYVAGNGAHIRAVADMNADGLPDLIGYKQGQGTAYLSILEGLGGGTFAAGYDQYFTNTFTGNVDVFDIGDADGDGDLDVVINNTDDLLLFVNNGQPTIGPPMLIPYVVLDNAVDGDDMAPRGALFTDANNDGTLDIIAWPVSWYVGDVPNGSCVLLRNANNDGYLTPVVQIMQPLGRSDIDSDGDEDLLAANVHKSRDFEETAGGVRKQVPNGEAGAGGVTPTLGAHGPFRVGESVELVLTGATGGINGWFHQMYVSDSSPVFGSGYQLMQRQLLSAYPTPLVTSGTPGDIGAGRWNLPFEVPAYVAGKTKLYFVELQDPFAASGHSRSNDLRITYGP